MPGQMFHTIYSTSCERGRTVACVSMMPVRLIVVPFVIGGVRRLSLPNVVCVKFRSYALHIACRGRVVGFLHRPRSSGDSPRKRTASSLWLAFGELGVEFIKERLNEARRKALVSHQGIIVGLVVEFRVTD